ncbi:hypothetical protein [Rubritalea tangerina]
MSFDFLFQASPTKSRSETQPCKRLGAASCSAKFILRIVLDR